MKKLIFSIIMSLIVIGLDAQNLEVEGKAKITVMDKDNTVDSVVVRLVDGTLAVRDVSSLPDADSTNEKITGLMVLGDSLSITEGSMTMKVAMDSSNTNELQLLSTNGDTIFVSGGNFITVPGLSKVSELLSVQERVNNGETPLEIFTSGIPIASLYGKTYQGGLIFYVDINDDLAGIEGMVSAPTDALTALKWGNSGGSVDGCNGFATGATLTGIGDGATNTMTVLNAACDSTGSAFVYVDALSLGGYTDWFLPSKEELNQMYGKIGPGAPAPNTNIGGFATDWYWSSTEDSVYIAWLQLFTSGNQVNANKGGGSKPVRAIRAF